MVKNETGRSAFIGSTIEVARGFGLDGVDLDWEFPKDGEEMEGFGMLVAEWRAAVEREAAASGRRKLLLSAAVYYGSGLSLGGVVRFVLVSILFVNNCGFRSSPLQKKH